MLPEPEKFLQRHSETLCQLIRDTIKNAGGWIGFDQYMQMALYQPGLGYYAAGSQKFGPDGDFITAPMMGQLFAACIADQCAEVLALDSCDTIVEFGAGNGELAAGILQNLATTRRLPARYLIVETSADLVARQRHRIEQLATSLGEELVASVQWLECLPQSVNGIVIGNEIVDAIPFKRFEIDASGKTIEMGVSVSGKGFCWQQGEAIALPLHLDGCGIGYQSEWSPQAEAWVQSIGEIINCGVLLLIDYGFPDYEFYHPDRQQGTLMCHYRHHAHSEPFYWPGLQDITCHVDFSAIARAGQDAGMNLQGYTTQGEFLMAGGLLQQLERCISDTGVLTGEEQTRRQLMMAAEVKKLTLPHEMGELFKVIALGRSVGKTLSGFSRSNKCHRLIND